MSRDDSRLLRAMAAVLCVVTGLMGTLMFMDALSYQAELDARQAGVERMVREMGR